MKFTTLFFHLLLLSTLAFSQKDPKVKKDPYTSNSLWEPIPINRQLSHDKIDRLQKSADEFDEKLDGKIILINNKKGSEMLTESIIKKVDQLQLIIENLPLDHWAKVKYLMYLEEDLKQYYNDMTSSKANPLYYENLINNFEVIFKKQQNNEPIVDYINANFTRSIYGSIHMFKEDRPALEAVYNNMVRLYPDEMMTRFYEFSDKEAAVTLMSLIAPLKPNLILTYATSTSFERNIVRKSNDSLIKAIVNIADNAKKPLRAIVFLEDLKSGKKTLSEVNTITQENALYYKHLILQRLIPNNVAKKILDRECKEQALEYVRTMNELHDAQDPVRFKCIEPLSAKEIYFLMVLCSDEIYTSTFVGSFNRMLTKMAPLKGDVFLQELEMDKFRTFIRMCAGYNKLSQYLASIDEPNRNTLMATFVHNIDKNKETDLEDAVDVADAIGSIQDDNLIDYLLSELKKDYERTYVSNNKRGLIIYFLLHTLTVSIINPEQTSEDLQTELKIPPIAFVPIKNILNDSGRVVEQVYFYGDEDGKSSYNSFISNYKPEDWKIVKNDKWVTMTSLKGKPITVYANLPLDEPEDEESQRLLVKHLEENNIKPSIVIHRGHSYHLPGTLKYLNQDNKIIILGSCGGYHNLSTILGSSEDAHIISSKQTGTMYVTDPIIRLVQERILAGKDINWIEIWTELATQMKTPGLMDKFNDYVPPHKNMGALFLKAFKIQMQENQMM
ncbi:MAG: hypothetical protein IPL09_03740 [Bacteroidetes bacterium]|jgi:hypothetical protein|nr:hypothetical protein [Bacteroidota bacterium]MBK6818503.1 hypothetical protein [Bacteroidota bacterium]MBK8328596.1 hypothetical protein [Bacteroidota bacterium]MBK9300554.1 hypothetical protein [Bacteroidota bacterium]